jgi:hypothetical protein
MALSQPRARAKPPVTPTLVRPALLLAALLLAAPAHAAEPPVELSWDAPASCPAEAFHAPLRRYLGARASTGPTLPVQVRLREAARGRWQLDLDIAAAGARRLTAERCETAADAAAFIVAQALTNAAPTPTPPDAPPPDDPQSPTPPALVPEPNLDPGPTAPPLVPGPTAPPLDPAIDTPPGPAPDPLPPAIPPRPAPQRLALRLGGGFSGGALPAVGGELGLLLGLLGPRWRVDLLARGLLPTRATSRVAPEVSARLGLWALGARACAVPRRARLEFPLCAGAELGQVLARSQGLAANGRAELLWAALTASPGLAWSPRPWLALVASAQLAVALIRHDIVVRGLPRLHRLGPVDAGLSLALEWRFPGARRPRPGS